MLQRGDGLAIALEVKLHMGRPSSKVTVSFERPIAWRMLAKPRCALADEPAGVATRQKVWISKA